jgi:hypothetical protein
MTVQQQQAQLDHRAAHLQKLLEQAPEPLRKELERKLELSWIYHESALEGVVYSPDELIAALGGGTPTDPVMVSSFDEIRQSKNAIDLVRTWAAEKRTKIDAEVVRDIYACLAPDEVDGKKPPAYRKDMPLHRLYFHEIAAPDKIVPKLKAFGQWINAPETRRSTHALRLAAKAHFHLLHIYPYPKHSGRVARLVMNLVLMSAGYPPAVIHSTERQRYYDALKTSENALAQIVKEALTASIESGIRFLESRLPPPAPVPMKKAKYAPRKARPEPSPSVSTQPRASSTSSAQRATSAPPRGASAPSAQRTTDARRTTDAQRTSSAPSTQRTSSAPSAQRTSSAPSTQRTSSAPSAPLHPSPKTAVSRVNAKTLTRPAPKPLARAAKPTPKPKANLAKVAAKGAKASPKAAAKTSKAKPTKAKARRAA